MFSRLNGPGAQILRLSLLLILLVPALVLAGQDIERTFQAQSYPGSKNRDYIVHLPTGYDGSPRPLVMVLHGCKQTHRTIKSEAGFDAVADQEGFIVVYPFITRYDGLRNENCWGFWFEQEIHAGAGEVEDLWRIIEEVGQDYPVDAERIHVTGLSSGAAMAVAVMVAHSERIASGGETAGLAYSETPAAVPFVCNYTGQLENPATSAAAMNAEMGQGKRVVSLFIVHSRADCTVNVQAAYNLRDSWGLAFGVDTTVPTATSNGVTEGTAWTRRAYGPPGAAGVIETLILEDLPHGWYGGNNGQYAFANAPDTARLMWNFFAANPLGGNAPPLLSVDSAFAHDERCVTVTGSASDPDGIVVSVTVALAGESSPAPVPAPARLSGDSYSFTACQLTDNTRYTPRVTARDDGGATVEVLGEAVVLGDPPVNQPPTLTLEAVTVADDCISLTGEADDDLAVAGVEVRLGTGPWQGADLTQQNWAYRECGLPAGSYATAARARDGAGLTTTVTGPPAVVTVRYDSEVSADLTGHLVAQRIRLYPSGFGSADRSYLSLYLEHGVSGAFPLYRAGGVWYADPAAIPVP